MDSNKHHHAPSNLPPNTPQNAVTASVSASRGNGILILGGLSLGLLAGLLFMGYKIVSEQQELSAFQTFTIAVLSFLVTGFGGLYLKISNDKAKEAEKERIARAEAEARTMKHEETLETIRLQTNGRLHKRDEQLESFRKLVSVLDMENRALRQQVSLNSNKMIEAIENVAAQEPPKTIILSDNEAIKTLQQEIQDRDEELKKLRPLYPEEK